MNSINNCVYIEKELIKKNIFEYECISKINNLDNNYFYAELLDNKQVYVRCLIKGSETIDVVSNKNFYKICSSNKCLHFILEYLDNKLFEKNIDIELKEKSNLSNNEYVHYVSKCINPCNSKLIKFSVQLGKKIDEYEINFEEDDTIYTINKQEVLKNKFFSIVKSNSYLRFITASLNFDRKYKEYTKSGIKEI